MHIYIKSAFIVHLFVHLSICYIFLSCNNSALGSHRVLLKVANERYCSIVLTFLSTCTHAHKKHLPKKQKKIAFWGVQNFFWGGTCTHMHVQRACAYERCLTKKREKNYFGGMQNLFFCGGGGGQIGACTCSAYVPKAPTKNKKMFFLGVCEKNYFWGKCTSMCSTQKAATKKMGGGG